MKAKFQLRFWCLLLLGAGLSGAEEVTVTARVALVNDVPRSRNQRSENVVLWLVPAGTTSAAGPGSRPPRPQLVQRSKTFEPHLLVIPVGSVVEFPNRDPFFHNVFSLFEGKRFDLGLYEAGSSRDVLFDKPGISYIFCDIHAQMSAVIIAVPTPYFAISNRKGEVVIPHVPAGHYTLHLWSEVALPAQLNRLTRDVAVSENGSSLGLFRLTTAPLPETHKDKYGREYDPPSPDSPAYAQP
jgi:plastocyanin